MEECIKSGTAWKVAKYGVFSGPYFSVFRMNMEIYGVTLRILSEYRKIWTRKTFMFGHFSPNEETANVRSRGKLVHNGYVNK